MNGSATPAPGQVRGRRGEFGRQQRRLERRQPAARAAAVAAAARAATASGSSEPTATETLPSPSGGPYVVSKSKPWAARFSSGYACKVTQPFNVTAAARRATFPFFLPLRPLDGQHGHVSYRYSIPSAGEMHDAAGLITLSPLGTDGTCSSPGRL